MLHLVLLLSISSAFSVKKDPVFDPRFGFYHDDSCNCKWNEYCVETDVACNKYMNPYHMCPSRYECFQFVPYHKCREPHMFLACRQAFEKQTECFCACERGWQRNGVRKIGEPYCMKSTVYTG